MWAARCAPGWRSPVYGDREKAGHRAQVGGSLDNLQGREPSGTTRPAGLSPPGDMGRCTGGQGGIHTHPYPWASTHRNCTHWEKERKISSVGCTLLVMTAS